MRPTLALLALPLLLAACVNNSGGSTGDDSGVLPGEDSGPPPVGEDSGAHDATVADSAGQDSSPGDSTVADSSEPDAPTGDTSTPDAGTDAADAAPPPVSILVTTDIGPEPGVTVLFHDATGAIVDTEVTGADGTATSSTVPAGGQVTAVFQNAGGGFGLFTIQGVEPGDQLTAFDSVNIAFPLNTSMTVVSLPDAGALDAQAYSTWVGTQENTVDSPALPFSISNVGYPNELGGEAALLLAIQVPESSTELAYTYQRNVSYADGGLTAVGLTTPWLTDESQASVVVTNEPGPVSGGNNYRFNLSYGELGGTVPTWNTSQPGTEDGGSSASFTTHPTFALAVQTEGTFSQDLSNYATDSYVTTATRSSFPDASASAALDMSQALPVLTTSAVDTTDAGSSSRPSIYWTATGSLASAQGIVTQANFTLDLPEAGTGPSFTWLIVAPPTATSITPPALPATYGTPVASVQTYQSPVVVAFEATFFSGYADARHAAAGLAPTPALVNDNGAPITSPLPVDGTLQMTAITNAGD